MLNDSAIRSGTTRAAFVSRGAALITALALTLVLTFIVGGLAYVATSWITLSLAKDNSERALELGEAGVNYELNYIATQRRANASSWYHLGTTQSGQPYPGQPGTLPGVTGKFWVYTTAGSGGTFFITCNTLVNGAYRKIVTINGSLQSLFTLYGAFAVRDLANGGTGSVLTLNSGANVTISGGALGTNGPVSTAGATLAYPTAMNADDGYSANSGHQLTGGTLQPNPYAVSFPTVGDMIRYTYSATAGDSDSQAWSWLATATTNTGIKQWKSGLSSGATLSTSNAVTDSFTSGQSTLSNWNGTDKADWKNANFIPGSATVRALILPPGDYYFTSVSLRNDSTTQLILDNGGLSVGGNSGHTPVRIWINSSGTGDTIQLPVLVTDTTTPATIRIYYGKTAATLLFGPTVTNMSGTSAALPGVIYGVSGGTAGATVQMSGGGTSATMLSLTGCLVADNLLFSGYCKVTLSTTGNTSDFQAGAGTTGGYVDGGG